VGSGLRDPRSQKRDLGHPSVSRFDIADGTSFVISLPTRPSESAARDDKAEGDAFMADRSGGTPHGTPGQAGQVAGPQGLSSGLQVQLPD
jgi:hypothetical protein